jgi:hypothetical protein
MSKDDALKDYVTVNERIAKFYDQYPAGRIITELVSWNDGIIIMKAFAFRDETNVISSTGHAYEKEGTSYINKTSALENCETSVVGRCLANLGLEIKRSVASKEEVENAIHQQEILKQEKNEPIPDSLKIKYQLAKGDTENFEEWVASNKVKGYSYQDMQMALIKKIQKNKEMTNE